MKTASYIILLTLSLLAPLERADVGKLRPVEVVAVRQSEAGYLIRTDTGDRGQGNTLAEALADMKARAPGVIYLDTAEYLLLESEIEERAYLGAVLKPGVRVCAAEPGIDLEGSGQYLDVHHPAAFLSDEAAYPRLEILCVEDAQYHLK